MNFYHRLNQFLLERFPSMWNTQFVWVMLCGFLLHFLFFTAGYVAMDLELLKTYSIGTHFFSSSIFSIYIVLCLITFIFAAFRYFSHNPFRNFYPIGKGYFWKVYLMLFLEIFVFLSVFWSYETGMKLKAGHLVSDREIKEDIVKINKALPFLFNEISEYHITKRAWPKPFPLDDLRDFTIGYDSINQTDIKHGIDKSKPFVTLHGEEYQFGRLQIKAIDSCRNETVIEQYTDISQVYGLQEYSLYNFSGVYFDSYKNERYQFSQYAPTIHRLYQNRNVDSIREILSDVKDVAIRYHLHCFWDAQRMAETIFRQNMDDNMLLRVGFTDVESQIEAVVEAQVEAVETSGEGSNKNIAFNYSVDLNRFKQLCSNKEELDWRMGYKQLKSELAWVLIFLSMVAAFLLIIFKYVVLREILIGTVVAGIMIAVSSLITYLFVQKNIHYDPHYYMQQEKNMTLTISIICAAIIMNGLYRILSSAAKKKWASLFFVSTLGAMLVFIPAFYNFIRIATMKVVHSKCQTEDTWVYRYSSEPWHFFLLYLPLLGLVFFLLRRLHAKSE